METTSTAIEPKETPLIAISSDKMEVNDMKDCSAANSDVATSDASNSSIKSSDGYLPTTDPTSSSSSDSDIVFSSDEDFSSDDVEETIDFIRQKQGILKRAASVLIDHEELYDAATARATSHMTENETRNGNIWSQAKRMVPQKKATPRRVIMRRSTAGPNRGERRTVKPNPCDPNIELGEVDKVASAKFDAEATSEDEETDVGEGLPEVAFTQSQWMAKALVRSSSTFSSKSPSDPNDCRWKVVSDPLTCSLGLVPPPSISMEHGITIEDALSLSEEGRLLTQATPPFCVVYVNKACMMLAGLTSKELMIGRPVESFLQVTQDILRTPKAGPDDDFIRSRLLRNEFAPSIPDDDSRGQDYVHCRMMIVPVMDRSRRRRLTPHARQAKRFSCMSHVLVRIRQSDEAVSPSSSSADLRQEDPLAVSESESRKEEDYASSSSSSGEESIRSNMVETVG